MSGVGVIQVPCEICGASISNMIMPKESGAESIHDLMPKHIEWHKSIEKAGE